MKLAAGLLLLAIDALPSSTQYFRYERPITGIAQTGKEVCVHLSADVFAQAAPQLADLRLYRGAMEVPYAIREAAPSRTLAEAVPLLNLGLRGKETAFDAAMPDGSYNDVELAVSATNFIATVTVTGSRTESDAHETKLGTFTIFDLSGQKLGRSTVLHLPPSDFRFLHFRVAGPLAPAQFAGISLLHRPMKTPTYLLVQSTAHVEQKDRHTLIEFEVPAHVPVDRVLFAPGAQPADFSREVAVSVLALQPQSGADGDAPSPFSISSGTLLRLHTVEDGKRIDTEQLAVDVPQGANSDVSRWTVNIDNGDDAPLQLTSVQLQMRERTLCFTPDSSASYTLFYGDLGLQAPHYDYAALHSVPVEVQRASVGAEQNNPGYRPRTDARPFTDRHPALLWAALVGVIALLGSFALRSMRENTGSPQ